MKKVLKWLGIIIGIILVLLIILIGGLYFTGSSKLANAPDIAVQTVPIPDDEAALARGKHLAAAVSLCEECHGDNLGGQDFINEAPIGLIAAPNLTSGQGGIGANYSDEDWVRAIRHGVGGDGRVLGGMPSNAYAHLSDEDLGAVIAYVKSVPPVEEGQPARDLMFMGQIIFGVMAYDTLPFSLIDHEAAQNVTAPAEGVTGEYGDYLTKIGGCIDCHGSNLAGLTDPNGPPPGPNLTPGGNLANWTEDDFIQTIRLGNTPEGTALNPEEMPWPWYANMTDDELKAIWLHLESLPARELGDN